jgi:hypothetical protein
VLYNALSNYDWTLLYNETSADAAVDRLNHAVTQAIDLAQSCTSRAHRTVCEDVCSSACTRAYDATAWPGM